MELVALWLRFLGAWLLFAGPIYQAALELQDEDIAFDRIHTAGAKVEKAPSPSIWWWFLPPVKIYLDSKQRHENQIRYMKALTPEDVKSIVSFRNKETGWLFVAAGGFCIACADTYDLTHHEGWNNIILIALIIIMALLSITNLITLLKRAKRNH